MRRAIGSVLSVGADVEQMLAAGELVCPACGGGRLGPWGWCEPRVVRGLAGDRTVRPRRARCRDCEVTHALLPGFMVPRRRDDVHVIGAALTAYAGGDGHRVIARRLRRPTATVRGWLRRLAARADTIRQVAAGWVGELDRSALARVAARRSASEDALEMLGLAISAAIRQLDASRDPWELAVRLTDGLLGPPGRAVSPWSGPVRT
jgi:Domain of unknown function (DUF6431)